MVNELIIKTFIKDYRETDDLQVRSGYGILEGWISIVLNLLLFFIKLFAGLFVNSLSLIGDAIHSLSDMGSSIAVVWGFKIAGAPPDKEHPFGHERMEYIITLIIAVLLMVAGLEFLKAAIQRTIAPSPVLFQPWIIAIISSTIVIKEWLARFSRDLGNRIKSPSLQGDFIHHRTDAITTAFVLLPLFSSKVGLPVLDGIVGIVVSLFIVYTGWSMVQEIITPLLGESATYDELLKIKSIAMSVQEVKGVHDIIMHKYGNIKIISMHAEIMEDIPFMEAHDIIEEVEEQVNEQMNASTVIHLDPLQKITGERKKIHDRLKEIVAGNELIASYHDVRIVKVKGETVLILDVVVSHAGFTTGNMKKIHDRVESILKTAFPDCTIKVWVEPQYHKTV